MILKLIRYRFMLFAGILPFLLGQAIAHQRLGVFSLYYFAVTLLGLFFTLVGVEAFNEYFDWKYGSDRVFALRRQSVPHFVLSVGIIAFFLAFIVALYLTKMRGFPIMIFAILGFIAAAFYEGPPIRLTYRGLGEFSIFLAYGPLMTLGSYFVQAQRLDKDVLVASFLPGFLIMALTLANEIPDYLGDKLVGKRNIAVRLGQKNAVRLYGVCIFSFYLAIILGILSKSIPSVMAIAFFSVPYALTIFLQMNRTYERAASVLPAIRGTLILYVSAISFFIISYLC